MKTARSRAAGAPGPVFTISELAFEVLWDFLGLPDMPETLTVSHRGQDRRGMVSKAWSELQRAGLADSSAPHPRLVALFTILARPRRAVSARLWLGGPVRAYAAAVGDQAAFGVHVGGYVNIHAIRPEDLARAPVSLLLDAAPGPGCTVSLPNEVIADARFRSIAGPGNRTQRRAPRIGSEEANWLAETIYGAGDRGEFTAAVIDHMGYSVRDDELVGFFDSPNGRYLIEEYRAADGRDWTTVEPANGKMLVDCIEKTLMTLSGHLMSELARASEPAFTR
ncbi:ESX secretion-associated protein EspG [Kibdelosporangium persicum]|uniref:ESAT-6 protein secretion system EspG family protein n=1 Tax=Kibdelosporangium persicum TaxID=2698649 RepID=A0ABX2EYV1_9PSEU|nr:ESX secretion-associated protein EspG [Kibdelosporangium persicum]NRN64225.1 ESAT-6 protein secretion system EspG family protein [Kibdelosporangium persicum]